MERTVKIGELNAIYRADGTACPRKYIVPLQKKECVILELLIDASPKVVSREKLLEELWDDHDLSMKTH